MAKRKRNKPGKAIKGRPSLYKPEYCQMLIAHMEEGLSFESFAGVVRVDRATIYNWLDDHGPFLDAKKIGEAVSLLFWEKIGRAGTIGKIDGFSVGAYVFNMKNRFGWTDVKNKPELDQEKVEELADYMDLVKSILSKRSERDVIEVKALTLSQK